MEDSPKIKLGVVEIARKKAIREANLITARKLEEDRTARKREQINQEMQQMAARKHQRLLQEYNELYNPNQKIEDFVNRNPELSNQLRVDQDR